MLFVYALAAVVSFAVAWIIKLVFSGIQKQKAGAQTRLDARAEKTAGSRNGTPRKG